MKNRIFPALLFILFFIPGPVFKGPFHTGSISGNNHYELENCSPLKSHRYPGNKFSPAGRIVSGVSSEWGYAYATGGVSPEKLAAWCVRMQLSNLLSGIPVSIWYDWKNDWDSPTNFEHNCGTVTSGLEPKPAYSAMKKLNRQLKGYKLYNRVDASDNQDYLLIFRNDLGRFRLVAWTTGKTHTIELGNYIRHARITGGVDGYGNDLLTKTGRDHLNLELSTMPRYVDLSHYRAGQ